MNTPKHASDEQIAKLFGDDIALERATAAAIDRVNSLMQAHTKVPELFFSTKKRRNMVYDEVPVGHSTGYRCYDGDKHDSESAFTSGEYGDGLSENEAYVAWLRNEDDIAPRPRLGRLVDGGGGVQPAEYVDDYRDPDEPHDD